MELVAWNVPFSLTGGRLAGLLPRTTPEENRAEGSPANSLEYQFSGELSLRLSFMHIYVLQEFTAPSNEDPAVTQANFYATNTLAGRRFELFWRGFPRPPGIAKGTFFFSVAVQMAR